MELFSLCYSLLLLCTAKWGAVKGQQILKVSEGINSYPKLLTTFPIFDVETTQCKIDSVDFPLPHHQRTPLIPQLFGIKLQKNTTVTSTTVGDVTTTSRAVTMPSTTGHATQTMSDVTITSYNATTADGVTAKQSNDKLKDPKNRRKRKSDDHFASGWHETNEPRGIGESVDNRTTAGSLSYKPAPVTPPIYDYGDYDVGAVEGKLLQLYDLDREKMAIHAITVHCSDGNGTESKIPFWFIIEVTDINDNTPVFVPSSLYTRITPNVSYGDIIMLPRATDADKGINALLNFNYVAGTQSVRFKNGTKLIEQFPIISIWKTGQVIFSGYQLRENTVITFKIAVKDLGARNDGNRATATATIEVCSDCNEISPPPRGISLWTIVVPSVIFVLILTFFAILVIRKVRMKRRSGQCTLVIDDETLLGNASEL